MTTQRARFESYFALPGPRLRDVEAVVLAAADAYDLAEKIGKMSPEGLRTIVDAVSSHRSRIWENCCPLLAAASERWPEAADAIAQMSRISKAHVRFNANCSLTRATPQDIIDDALNRGLTDRSARVRWKAAETADRLDQRHLIPEVAAALATEKNQHAKASMEISFRFLRDGYVLRRKPNGAYSVTARLPGGGGSVRDVSANELNLRGIDAIVSEMRENYGARRRVQ